MTHVYRYCVPQSRPTAHSRPARSCPGKYIATTLALILAGCSDTGSSGAGAGAGAGGAAAGQNNGDGSPAGGDATSAGGSGDDQPGGTAPAGLGPPSPEVSQADKLPAFVALGAGFRTMISCDDGETWKANTYEVASEDDFSHSSTAPRALLYGDGSFVAGTGWGKSGTRLLRSRDGVNWQVTLPYGENYWDAVFGNGTFVFAENQVVRSDDAGETWSEPERLSDGQDTLKLGGHTRLAFGVHSEHGKRFVAHGRQDTVVYSNDAQTWTLADIKGDALSCLTNPVPHGAVFGADTFLMVSAAKPAHPACLSTDGGASWQVVSESFSPEDGQVARIRQAMFVEDSFYVFTDKDVYTSEDAVAWSRQEPTGMASFKEVAYSPVTGTWVGVTSRSLHRSQDALEWVELAPEAYVDEGPNLSHVEFGYVNPSGTCSGE